MKLITLTLPHHLRGFHDPRNKKTGTCPIGGGSCTDVTGAHHTVIAFTDVDVEVLRNRWGHITRIEEVLDEPS